MGSLFGERFWRPRGEQEQTERLNADFRNGSSSGPSFETDVVDIPLTPTGPGVVVIPMSPRAQRLGLVRSACAAAIFAMLLATMVALLVATVLRCQREGAAWGCLVPKKAMAEHWGGDSLWPPKKVLSSLAFGSCSAYDVRQQPIWEQGIIPSQPDAWVWLGDMFYADEPPFECSPANINSSLCQCTPTWYRAPPFMCPAGDQDNARDKMMAQVLQPGYQAFLRYACPGFDGHVSGAAVSVPAGDDLEVCPRPVLGVYDDHDYGINNFNRRLPSKHSMKQIFLDALGVPAGSPRRAAQQGIQWAYKLNPGTQQEVDLVLLDERYERAPLPCEVRGDWCRNIVLKDAEHPEHAWCEDYLQTGGASGSDGSCCKADGAIYNGWCKQEGSNADPLWQLACNASSPQFGQQPVYVTNGSLHASNTDFAAQTEERSSFCEVLGAPQRRWLERVLASSRAPVKLIASGSVLFGSSGLGSNSADNDWRGWCSGDDWDCYRPAQLNLLHTLQRHAAATGGCYVVLTGDYHYSDIKLAKPGSGLNYSTTYETPSWVTPIYQVMASGMSNSTARPDAPCQGYRRETSGLRIEGECGFVKVPAFGMLVFDWDRRQLSMQIRGGEGADGGRVLQQLTISLDTCQPV